ncbi:hypothetical protein L484_009085 [Morus notabilis]|uniref:Uncharacterized protein n=1 Tax=Morus notabilis TaxID=981085 RepID=W9QWR9_9ROSA|nr:hypothetical protein L484_009085 [Morus notabilis]
MDNTGNLSNYEIKLCTSSVVMHRGNKIICKKPLSSGLTRHSEKAALVTTIASKSDFNTPDHV